MLRHARCRTRHGASGGSTLLGGWLSKLAVLLEVKFRAGVLDKVL